MAFLFIIVRVLLLPAKLPLHVAGPVSPDPEHGEGGGVQPDHGLLA